MNTDIADLIAGVLGVSRGTAYDMMREALAVAQQQEPVAYMNQNGVIHHADYEWLGAGNILTPLYTSPQPSKPWVGLDDTDLAVCDTDGVRLARYWERVLREKNS